MLEVLVTCVQGQIMLQDECGQPHVIRRNGRSLRAKLAEDGGIVMGGLVVSEERVHTLFQEETSQGPFVLSLPAPVGEAGPEFAELSAMKRENQMPIGHWSNVICHMEKWIDMTFGIWPVTHWHFGFFTMAR